MKISLNDFKDKKYAISDNGDLFYPQRIFIEILEDDVVFVALFDQETAPDIIKEHGQMTSHEKAMYMVTFKSNGHDDIVELIEIK